ncbi:type I restriction enzyme HsdR N-terminal domain-containing protein [Halalkalicoccus subterraneus]|uniref:type I restriction enzyme HsdR N-terminal domain-containing protein n=1 Tax=Halalkalicoccus subterraneus TaxID=2675002 RepID=UPI000EFC21A9|nr:type I restriction enzyme HsdR N-terminal domain-containing protein [Halalkalicoccus subterraneus]
MDEDAIKEYVERSLAIVDSSPQMNEESTREKLVRPLIELLDWDFYFEVEPEYPVQMGSTRKKVDYALILEETPVVFIEVKGNDTTVSDSDQDQLRSYMRQVGVDWGLLTNGDIFVILKRQTDRRRPTETTLGEFTLDKLEGQIHLLKTLSKESIESGESESIAQNIEAIQQAVNRLRNGKDDIAEKVGQVVISEIGDVASQQIEKEAKQFIDGLIATLDEQSQEINKGRSRTEQRINLDDPDESEWIPEEGANAIVGRISRQEIEGDNNATVAVFPTKKSGIPFLKENNAWGFVRVGRNPEFAAMYVSEGESEIRYVARIKDLVKANEASLARPLESYVDQAKFDSDKKVVVFEPDSLHELEDPIPYQNRWPQSRQYTSLGEFREADTTDDIL